VECVLDDDCRTYLDRIWCDKPAGRCVECFEPSHCRDVLEECSPDGRCAIPCVNDECLGEERYCDPTIGYCVECRNDGDCDPDEVCRLSECVDGVRGS
jgi:hypothetical protein